MSEESKATAIVDAGGLTPSVDVGSIYVSSLEEQGYGTKAGATVAGRVAILVLGMHRSGTSAVTRLLSLAGAGLPDELIEAGEGNRSGHWESRPLVLHNDDLLKQMGAAWSDWHPLDWSALSDADIPDVEKDIAALVAEQFGDVDLLVLKDPRICRLIPLYKSALSRAGYRAVAVLPYRNPAEVIDSLMARSNWPNHAGRVDAALLWLTYVLEAERASRDMPRIFINFGDLLSDWQPLIAELQVTGGLHFPVPTEQLAVAASEFLSQSERHQRRTTGALTRDPVTNGWVKEAYHLLSEFRSDPASVETMTRFDALRAALADAMPMLQILAHMRRTTGVELEYAKAEVAQARANVETLRADLDTLRADRQSDRQEIAALRQDNTLFRNDLEAMRLHVNAQAQELDVRAQRMSILEGDLQAARIAHEADVQALHEAYRGSRSWRLTAPLRAAKSIKSTLRQGTASARASVARRGWRASAMTALVILKNEGVRGLRLRLKTDQTDMLISHEETAEADYVNYLASKRRDVLLSDWHVRLHQALHDNSPPAVEGQTLGLSLVTYNSSSWLPGFFTSLLSQSFPLSRLNVFIVDHGSSDDTLAVLEAHRLNYGDRYASFTIHGRPNLGFGAGHDYAIRHLSDPFVLISNVDLEFHPNTIDRALRAALVDSEDIASWELRQCPYEHPKYYDPVTLEAVWSSHACILMRRAAYLQVGGYDNRIFMYGEDVELSYRLRGAGWRLRYLPQVPVTHHVDLADPSVRPLQLSGSVTANILLRYRFGGPALGAEGEALLAKALHMEHDPRRQNALSEAQKAVAREREYFQNNFKPEKVAPFPFSGFDYVVAREGADIKLQSDAPYKKVPRVTVVTRTHGPRVDILREAIASVLNQTYPDIEHVIVEDRTDFASDLVADVASAYGTNIRYLKSEGSGRSAAGNFGLSNATGELIMFLDNDDLLFPDHVEVLVRALDAHPEHVGAYSMAWDTHTLYDEQGNYRELVHALPAAHRMDFDRNRLKQVNFIPIQSMLFRRSLFDREGGFDNAIDHLEDWHLWARYSLYGDFTIVRKVTSLYRTPAEPEIRARRQAELDGAYEHVRSLINDRKDLN